MPNRGPRFVGHWCGPFRVGGLGWQGYKNTDLFKTHHAACLPRAKPRPNVESCTARRFQCPLAQKPPQAERAEQRDLANQPAVAPPRPPGAAGRGGGGRRAG
jgi:hypothetical protein